MKTRQLISFSIAAVEYEQIRHAADLNGLTVREYIVRAINQRLLSQGVDAVLLAERCDV